MTSNADRAIARQARIRPQSIACTEDVLDYGAECARLARLEGLRTARKISFNLLNHMIAQLEKP